MGAKTKGDVRAMALDLSSFKAVRGFAAAFLDTFNGKLHYLINNAGLDGLSRSWVTADGFESTFQVNYLGHFLLTELLLPALRENRPSRIINVGSTSHVLACQMMGWSLAIPPAQRCFRDWQSHLPLRSSVTSTQPWYPHYGQGGQKSTMYGTTKLLLSLHVEELAERELGSGPMALSVCPGLVESAMGSKVEALCREQIINPPGVFRQRPCPYTATVGAAVIAYAALHSQDNGKWLVRYRDCAVKNVFMNGFSDSDRHQIYQQSKQWVGLSSNVNATVSGDDVLV